MLYLTSLVEMLCTILNLEIQTDKRKICMKLTLVRFKRQQEAVHQFTKSGRFPCKLCYREESMRFAMSDMILLLVGS